MIFCEEYWHQIFRYVSLYLPSLDPIKLESKKGRFDSMSEPDIPGFDPDEDYGLAVARPELKKPSMYKVIMLNDDYTPMEFVIHVLELFFNMDQEKAMQIMLRKVYKEMTKILPLDLGGGGVAACASANGRGL